MRVLLVEDDAGVFEVLEEVLRSAGHEVIGAGTGADGLRLAAATSLDAALVDYHIPPPDGLEVLRSLRSTHPRCLRLLLSGHVSLPLTLEAVNQGEVARVIPKPFDPFDVVKELERAAHSRRHLEALCANDEARAADLRRGAFEDCLRKPLLHLAFQPIFPAGGGPAFAYEALLRSSDPRLPDPAALIGTAERLDRVRDLASRIVRMAAASVPWIPPEHLLFLNLHPAELASPRELLRRMEPLDTDAGRIVLEITERADVVSTPDLHRTISALTRRGYRIAVDDLGAGYSSLAVLANLKPHFIKVDRSIVSAVDRSPRKLRLIELLLKFGEAAGGQVIAEGVETAAEARTLVDAGVPLLQGFFLARPGPLLIEEPVTSRADA